MLVMIFCVCKFKVNFATKMSGAQFQIYVLKNNFEIMSFLFRTHGDLFPGVCPYQLLCTMCLNEQTNIPAVVAPADQLIGCCVQKVYSLHSGHLLAQLAVLCGPLCEEDTRS